MKHKHADLIHAWADGAKVQIGNTKGTWVDISNPQWGDESRYRIKPEEKKPVVRWLWAFTCYGDWKVTNDFYSQEEADKHGFRTKLEWSRTEFPE